MKSEESNVHIWGNLVPNDLPGQFLNLMAELWVPAWGPRERDPFIYRPEGGELGYARRRILRRYLGTPNMTEQAKRIGDLAIALGTTYDYKSLPESLRAHHQRGDIMTWTVIDECPSCGRSPARIDGTRFTENRGRRELVGYSGIECEFGCRNLDRLDELIVSEMVERLEAAVESRADELRDGFRRLRFAT